MIGRTVIIAAICIVALWFTSCTSTSFIAREQLPPNGDMGVTLRLVDGRTLRLEKGDYTVADDSTRTITGRGRIRGSDAPNDLGTTWEGSISSSQVASIRVEEYTALGQVGAVTLGVFFLTIVGLAVLVAHTKPYHMIVMLLAFAGCVDSRVVTADDVVYGEGDKLTLYLRDGRHIVLVPGEYTIRRDSVGEISGTGRLLGRSPNDLGSRWEGIVRMDEIDSVRTERDTGASRGFGITLQALTAAFGVLTLVLWLTFRNGHL